MEFKPQKYFISTLFTSTAELEHGRFDIYCFVLGFWSLCCIWDKEYYNFLLRLFIIFFFS